MIALAACVWKAQKDENNQMRGESMEMMHVETTPNGTCVGGDKALLTIYDNMVGEMGEHRSDGDGAPEEPIYEDVVEEIAEQRFDGAPDEARDQETGLNDNNGGNVKGTCMNYNYLSTSGLFNTISSWLMKNS